MALRIGAGAAGRLSRNVGVGWPSALPSTRFRFPKARAFADALPNAFSLDIEGAIGVYAGHGGEAHDGCGDASFPAAGE